jgi:transposase-like protein
MSTNAKKTASKGKRYSDSEKAEILEFITKTNAESGRGGQSAASKKFGISQLTLSSWIKKAANPGAPKGKPGRKPKADKVEKAAKVANAVRTVKLGRPPKAAAATGGGYAAKANELLALASQIDAAEKSLAQLKAKFNALKSAL